MLLLSKKLARTAGLALDRGQPELFKRIRRAAILLAENERDDYFDTDSDLNDTIKQERSEEPPPEEIPGTEDPDGLGDEEEEDEIDEEEAEDKKGDYGAFPVGAVGVKERRRGPQPWGVSTKPKWWKP